MFESPIPKTPEEIAEIERRRSGYEERTEKIAKEKGIDPKKIVELDAGSEYFFKSKVGSPDYPNQDKFKEKILREENSDLKLNLSTENGPWGIRYVDGPFSITGAIDGKEIEIKGDAKVIGHGGGNRYKVLEATVDGKKVTKEEAEKLFYEYGADAEYRSRRIENIRQESEKEKLKEAGGELSGNKKDGNGNMVV